MIPNTEAITASSPLRRRIPIWAIVLGTILITVLVTVLVIQFYFFPNPFDSVALSANEEQVLNDKLSVLIPGYEALGSEGENRTALEPEAYSETGANRELSFNEREINSMIAHNTDLADKLAIDLSNDLISAKFLMSLDPDFPIMGGKTIRINAGLNLSYMDGEPVAILRGVTVMGLPIPDAWLGNLKNIDLVEELGGDDGFWKSFGEGIELLNVQDGKINIKLNE